MLAPGALIAERYRLERQLGAGGMGVVWSARQVVTRQGVALKFLKDPDSHPTMRRRFLREARAACAVHHANVVQIHDLIEADGMPVIVMELLEGESLGAKLRRETTLGVEEFAKIMLPVVSAVGTAHALGIVHRDLKPDNIFLASVANSAANDVLVKVLDFGVAKLTATDGDAEKTAGLTTTGSMVGTPYYMSPEQAFGERDIDHRSDIWALGIISYRCLTGVLPTKRENVGQVLKVILSNGIPPIATVVPNLPADIADLVGRMLSAAREQRPSDLREVQEILHRHCDTPIVSFGTAVAPPPSSNRLLPEASPDSSSARTSAATPVARAAGSGSAKNLESPATLTDPMAPGAATLSDSVSVVMDSAVGHAATIPERLPSRNARPRWAMRIGILVLAIGGASAVAIASRDRFRERPTASSAAPPQASELRASANPEAVAPPTLPASTVVAASPPPPPTAASQTAASPASPVRQPLAKKPLHSNAAPVDSGHAPATATTAAPAKPSPPPNDVFVNKPPF